MRRDDATDDEAWVALWNGDAAHLRDATGYDGDIVPVPVEHLDQSSDLLRQAGHLVTDSHSR